MGEVFGVGISDEAQGLIAELELGVAEEGVLGRGGEPSCHLQDGVGRACLDACRQFLGFSFEFGVERFGHDGLLLGKCRPSFQTIPK